MRVNGKHYRTVWFNHGTVHLINQNLLPFEFAVHDAATYREACEAIRTMVVRGAPAIGAAAGFAMAQAFLEAPDDGPVEFVERAKKEIEQTRPTAQNLFYAANRVFNNARGHAKPGVAAVLEAQEIADEDVENCRRIGEIGSELVGNGSRILTHCNAGWLACVDYGTALSVIYVASGRGKKISVYVGETRPRNQGAKLTAWELKNEDIPCCIFADSAGAYVMEKEKIDMVIVGADRIAKNGDVANKIGTLEKAIVAKELGIPFYVAAPSSSIDLTCESGDRIPIEHRSGQELLYQTGINKEGRRETILVYPQDFPVMNPAFDVTPSKYVTAIITEKGIVTPDRIAGLVPGT